MLLSQEGVDKTDHNVVTETEMTHLVRFHWNDRSFEAGMLVPDAVFNTMVGQYGLRFVEFRTHDIDEAVT